jgi:hypothetical protein
MRKALLVLVGAVAVVPLLLPTPAGAGKDKAKSLELLFQGGTVAKACPGRCDSPFNAPRRGSP